MLKALLETLYVVFALLCMINALMCVLITQRTFSGILAVCALGALACVCRAGARSATLMSWLRA